ncbi:hypothetical protein NQ317_016289 [Molorchus minor]|uniref:CCHC-type domain-containing protein n=1 Tax=Molorchus minor TaxID=1323400 RepID=A0ABQ9J7T4_9CUCU|nr:hypothetical protein NQ317_016289 [Molorchus minor]
MLKVPVEHWDLLLIYFFEQKVDFQTKKAFEQEKDINSLPTLSDFFKFLEKRCLVLENLSITNSNFQQKQRASHHSNSNTNLNVNGLQLFCIFCKQKDHKIYKCTRFKNLHHSEKINFIRSNRLCFNCLGSKHTTRECTSQGCHICSKKHHSLLHLDINHQNSSQNNSYNSQAHSRNSNNDTPRENVSQTNARQHQTNDQGSNTNTQSTNSQGPSRNAEIQTVSAFSTKSSEILLATALVTLYSASNQPVQAKVLLDGGSQSSFITENLVARLNCTPYARNLRISGIGENTSISNKMVNVTIYSHVEENVKFNVTCSVLKNITCKLPQSPIKIQKLNIPNYIKLADPTFFCPSQIDMLIGADMYYDITTQGMIRLGKNLPNLQNTLLGWIIAGKLPANLTSHVSAFVDPQTDISLFTHTSDLDNLLTKFWSVEEILDEPVLSSDDLLAEDIFKTTTRILENGSYQVNLPLKSHNEHTKLGDSFAIARKRFLNLENRFERDSQTVTYGTKSAPYLATRVIKEVAEQGKEKYPFASDALLNQCYVDDILYGSDTYENLVIAYNELNSLANSANFKLHKWGSNSTKFLKTYCKNEKQCAYDIKIENVPSKVLGVSWDPNSDEFSITCPQSPLENNFTKREVLSQLSQMFDPLGLIGPVIVTGKIIMQKIWLSKINWDEQLDPQTLIEWKKFIAVISSLADLKVPRYLLDSEISLYWIKSHASRWAIFVANRVSRIQLLTSDCQWRHIKSHKNPADILSRGRLPNELVSSKLWWYGPEFLQQADLELEQFNFKIKVENPPEEKRVALITNANLIIPFWEAIFNRFSSFTRLQRTVAYMLRFINNSNPRLEKFSGVLTIKELQQSLDTIIKHLQHIHFAREISELESEKPLSNKNLISLNPFLDKSGILRVGGRLAYATLPYSQKHQILLPSKNHVVSLLLKREHIRLGHAGPQTVRNKRNKVAKLVRYRLSFQFTGTAKDRFSPKQSWQQNLVPLSDTKSVLLIARCHALLSFISEGNEIK